MRDTDRELIEKFYTVDGVSMKNIALYFVEIGRPIDESVISKLAKTNKWKRPEGLDRTRAAMPVVNSIYTRALKIMDSRL